MVCRKLSRKTRVGCILLKTVDAGSNSRNVERALKRWSRVPRGPKRVRHVGADAGAYVKSIPPTTENWLRKLYIYSLNKNTSTEDKHETNHINNKYNDTKTDTRRLHNL